MWAMTKDKMELYFLFLNTDFDVIALTKNVNETIYLYDKIMVMVTY